MNQLVLATRNLGKVRELEVLLQDDDLEILSLQDFPEIPEIIEDGQTFQDNALKKARIVGETLQLPTLADDSGLEVALLAGAPGVYSARFAGPKATSLLNNQRLLELLKDYPDLQERTAQFVSVIALVLPDGYERVVHGSCAGYILLQPQGTGGFGYDPLFYLPEYQATFAELPLKIKNQISHRGRAFRQIVAEIRKLKTRSIDI